MSDHHVKWLRGLCGPSDPFPLLNVHPASAGVSSSTKGRGRLNIVEDGSQQTWKGNKKPWNKIDCCCVFARRSVSEGQVKCVCICSWGMLPFEPYDQTLCFTVFIFVAASSCAAPPNAYRYSGGAQNARYLVTICCWCRTRVLFGPCSCGNAGQK